MRVAVVDCETTGLDSNGEPISIAAVLSTLDQRGFGEISDVWYGEQFPSVPISDGAFRVHGRTKQSLAGKSFDLDGLSKTLRSADVVVAHNAEFDYRMVGKAYPAIRQFPWFCSYRQWPFGNLPNKRLDTLCAHFGITKPSRHDALSDAKCLHAVLVRHRGKTERSRTFLGLLLRNPPWIAPSAASESEHHQEAAAINIYDFDRDKIVELAVGAKLYLEQGADSDRLVAYKRGLFARKRPIVSVLKSANPQIAAKFSAGFRIYLQVKKNDGRSMEFDVRATDDAG